MQLSSSNITISDEASNGSQNDKQHLLFKEGNFEKHQQSTYVNESADSNHTDNVDDHADNNKQDKLNLSRLPRRSLLTLLLLCVTNFCGGCSCSIAIPFFPTVAVEKGMSVSVTGLLFSSSELVNFVFSIFFGNYLLHIGAKFLYVSGVFVSGVCAILFGLVERIPAGAMFITISFVCQSLENASVPAFFTSGFAIMSSEFPRHISTVFGITETSMSLGLMAGPSVGGLLNQVGGFGLPFHVNGVIILLVGFVSFILLPPPKDTVTEKKSHLFKFLSSSLVWVAIGTSMATGLGNSFIWPVFSVYLEQFDLSPALIGLMFIIIPGLYGPSMAAWGYVLDKKDIKEVMTIYGSLLCAVGFLLIGPTPLLPFLPVQLWVIILGLFIYGLHFSAVLSAAVKCLLVGAGELGFENSQEAYPLVSGLFNAAFCLGTFIGPTVSGALVEAVGFRWAATYMSGVLFLTALCSMCYFAIRRLRKR